MSDVARRLKDKGYRLREPKQTTGLPAPTHRREATPVGEHRYDCIILWDGVRQRYKATSPQFAALTAYGETHAEAAENLRDAVIEHGDPPENVGPVRLLFE